MTPPPARPVGKRTPQTQPAKPAPPPRVDVIELHPLNAQGSLRAFVAVTLSGRLTIRDLRLIEQEGQRPWCSMPTKDWTDPQGKRRYRTLIDLPDAWMQAVQSAVLAAWENYQRDGILPGQVIGGRQA